MCPRCQRDSLTRFGPYPSDRICRWIFSCQRLDKGCGWWNDVNNPFAHGSIRVIGIEGEIPREKPKTMEEIHAEWRRNAGLDHLPFSKAIQAEEERILTEV